MINITSVFIDNKTENSVRKILKSGFLVQGEKVKELEDQLKIINKTKYAVLVNSGTAALHTALMAIGIKGGDEVITTPFSFIATVNAILMCGAKPIFVDISDDHLTIDPELIEAKITSRTKAILSVDLYGRSCEYELIKKIAKKHNLKIISDSAQAIGVEYKKSPIAKWADIVCFSFYATKNIMMGEGGALVTNDKKVYEYARRFRQHGQDMENPYIYHHLGYNYRSTDILAAIGLIQIKNLNKWTSKRQSNAKELINNLKNVPGIILPKLIDLNQHVFHQFTIRVTEKFPITRDKLQKFLLSHNVRSGIYYPSILPKHDFVKKITPYKKGMYKIAEKASKQVLSLPIHPMLKKSHLKEISLLIKRSINEKV